MEDVFAIAPGEDGSFAIEYDDIGAAPDLDRTDRPGERLGSAVERRELEGRARGGDAAFPQVQPLAVF